MGDSAASTGPALFFRTGGSCWSTRERLPRQRGPPAREAVVRSRPAAAGGGQTRAQDSAGDDGTVVAQPVAGPLGHDRAEPQVAVAVDGGDVLVFQLRAAGFAL
ncbi:hypothetical protein [Streptomyces sp. NPDC050287]|uniref:hypothetical protein n=1 Tax=Streptomyces sp. NPDC050287 TaxID=3365608 RepID=UPI0037B2F72E